ncbi:MAG: AI-2E family transporter [Candidatus Bilamarchaeaceae archaeon]
MLEDRKQRAQAFKMVFAAFLVVFMVYLVANVLWGYVVAFFLAIFGYVFLKPLYALFRAKGVSKTYSAVIAMVMGAVFVGIPTIIIFGILMGQISGLALQSQNIQFSNIMGPVNMELLQKAMPGVDVQYALNMFASEFVSQTVDFLRGVVLKSLEGLGNMGLQLLVMLFVLYYLLVGDDTLFGIGHGLIPFNKKNTQILNDEFSNITYSVLICTGLMGLIQAVPLTLVMMFFNVPYAVFLGFVAFLLTFIPFVGIPVVWIPVAIYEFMQGRPEAGLAIVVAGIILAVIENARPFLQNRVGNIHPLVSLLGVIIGVVQFGIFGVIIGPLLLSYAILGVRMFIDEYG